MGLVTDGQLRIENRWKMKKMAKHLLDSEFRSRIKVTARTLPDNKRNKFNTGYFLGKLSRISAKYSVCALCEYLCLTYDIFRLKLPIT